jgi:hypothetical protein
LFSLVVALPQMTRPPRYPRRAHDRNVCMWLDRSRLQGLRVPLRDHLVSPIAELAGEAAAVVGVHVAHHARKLATAAAPRNVNVISCELACHDS